MARHCAERARSSGWWVYVGDLIQKMTNDGVRADDIKILEQTHRIEQWRSFLNPGASRDTVVDEEHGDLVITIDRDERAARPMPLFFRACQGHSWFAHSIERMYAAYEFGMAWCHGYLLHITSLESIQESTLG
eukprot:138601-Pyramimonas_sp.AAC.1